MTDEEVKIMNALAEYIFIAWEMAHADPSQWDNFLVRLKKVRESIKRFLGL